MIIKVFADTICGWCFIGHQNLNLALKDFPNSKIKVEHVPFQLNPDMPQEGIARNKYLEIKFGGKEYAAPMYENMNHKAKEAGIDLNLDIIGKTPNTTLSHLLIILSEKFNIQNEMKQKIYEAYFINGQDIGERNILIKIGNDLKIDKITIEEFFNLENINKVNSYNSLARNKNINGVPFYEIGKETVSGAQSTKVLKEIIKRNLEA
jgi:predicted DsbA family dithiol-disulfide isomerase